MKSLTALALLFLSSWPTLAQQALPTAPADDRSPQQTASQPLQAAQVQTPEALEMQPAAELPHPGKYAVAFLPMQAGDGSVAFLVAPNGRIGTIPMSKLGDAAKAGYRPFNVADLLAITNAVADEEKDLQRRIKELSEDYDALAARYNRLAAVNSATQVQSQPVIDERQMMRAALFRSLLQRAAPKPRCKFRYKPSIAANFPLCA